MNPENYYIVEILMETGVPVQWALPAGVRVLIRPNDANANLITISTDPNGTTGVFPLQPPTGAGVTDEIILTRSTPSNLYFRGITGESVAIWTMPCGGDY